MRERGWPSASSCSRQLGCRHRTDGRRATRTPCAGEEGKSDLKQTLLLGSLFGLWYLFNIYFNM